MKKTLLVVFAFMLYVSFATAQTDTVTGFTFPSEVGLDSLNANYGTTQNMGYDLRYEDTAGNRGDITFTNGASDFAATAVNWDNGANFKYWSIKFKTGDFRDMVLYSKQRAGGNNGGPLHFKIQYRISGTDVWTDIMSDTITLGNDWTTGVVEGVALPAAINNSSESIYVRWIMVSNEDINGGNVTANGVSKIDDIFVIGVNNEGTEELLYAEFSIFPNPTQKIITIDAPFTIDIVNIYNSNGQLVKQFSGNETINIENLNAGFYFLNIQSESHGISISKKFIKQ